MHTCFFFQTGQLCALYLQIHDPVKKELKKKIQSDYAGLNGTDVMTVAWNVVMQKVWYRFWISQLLKIRCRRICSKIGCENFLDQLKAI